MAGEEVRFGSGDAWCAGWAYRPPPASADAAATAGAPCVVLGSGLSCVREQRLDAFAERFVAAGFACLAFDYRHFGASGGEPRQLMDAARQRRDWQAAIRFARAQEGVDPARVALWGFSLGGGHVQALALSDLDLAAAVCVAPVVDGIATLRHVGGVGHLLRLARAGLRDAVAAAAGREPYLVPAAGPPGTAAVLARPGALAEFEAVTPPGSSWRNELCARAALRPPYRLARSVGRIACPILYCVAEQDEINPPRLGLAAAARAPRGEARRYPGGHFDLLHGASFERVAADQVEFLRRALAPAQPAT